MWLQFMVGLQVMLLSITNVLNSYISNFHRRAMYLDIIKVSSPTDAQDNCFERSIKIDIKHFQHVPV
jgi:hypothetical protein